MKTRFIILAMFFIMLVQGAHAEVQPAIIGGIRNGLALGIMGEQAISRNVDLRYGVELSSGKESFIPFIGGKFFLAKLQNRYPLYFGFGLVGYYGGKKSAAGISLSAIFDRAFDIEPLFVECGIDVVKDSGEIQLQAGYRF